MSGNRVEELEAKVRTLEATVDGLTDELVETKERLHALEEEVGVEGDVLEGRPRRGVGRRGATESADAENRETGDGAADDGESSADDVNSEEADGEDDADSEAGDDIIVA